MEQETKALAGHGLHPEPCHVPAVSEGKGMPWIQHPLFCLLTLHSKQEVPKAKDSGGKDNSSASIWEHPSQTSSDPCQRLQDLPVAPNLAAGDWAASIMDLLSAASSSW